ncbi:MAG TPA: ABC transporter permease subunit [Anaerolineae bacterium]|jgi:arabinogalactan oligomer / maltooligosaccharide transport system permease protein|nr:ABC transporter permease subunit [Anaerolineae bacterium]
MNRPPGPAAKIAMYVILILMTLFALYPIWFAILASGRPGDRLYTLNLAGMFVPTDWTWENYRVLLTQKPFLTWIKNSLVVATSTSVLAIFLGTSAAFAFSRFKFRGREAGLIVFLAIQAFPGILALVPIAQILSALGGFGKAWGLIIAYMAGTLVFVTWNLKGYFDTIPIDLEEAGMIDGAGPVQSFAYIALPLARPALAVTALFGFMAGWGEFFLANILIPAPDAKKTVMVGMFQLAGEVNIPWGQFAAGAVIVIVPVVLVFLWLQRYLEAGLTVGGVKG